MLVVSLNLVLWKGTSPSIVTMLDVETEAAQFVVGTKLNFPVNAAIGTRLKFENSIENNITFTSLF